MTMLVRFCHYGPKIEIDERKEYTQVIIDHLISIGLIMKLVDTRVDEEDIAFSYHIAKLENNRTINLTVSFCFDTFDSAKRITVSIFSDQCLLTVDDRPSYLESLKVALSSKLKKDWDSCTWQYDKESELLSSDLYSKIHETENLTRRFINEVLSVIYGADWWEKIVPISIKKEIQEKIAEYKLVAPSYKHIDEKMLLLDVSDLLNIMELKTRKLDTVNHEKLNRFISGLEDISLENLKSILCEASSIVINLWDDCFGRYLQGKFKDDFHKFEKYRNHVAHNKLIDKSAYTIISKSIDLVKEHIKRGFEAFNHQIQSNEVVAIRAAEEAVIDEIIESETGLSRPNEGEIIDKFNETLKVLYESFDDYYAFRNDIEVTEFKPIEPETQNDIFVINHVIDDKSICIICSIDNIDDGWGEESELSIQATIDNEVIAEGFINISNGDYEYNDDQGYYMPAFGESISSNIEDFADKVNVYVNVNFRNYRKEADERALLSNVDGSRYPVADCDCDYCGERYVCIDGEFMPVGVCLNCGEINEMHECGRCGGLITTGSHHCDTCSSYFDNSF